MDGYQLGKDIQMILSRLERLESSMTGGARTSGPCGCNEEDEQTTFTEGTREVHTPEGRTLILASKSWSFPREVRTGKCLYNFEDVTIYSDGTYEDVGKIHCDHGVLFACDFETTMSYKNSSGQVLTTTSWSRGLAGTDDADIRERGFRAAIRDNFNNITAMGRHRRCVS